ncbi:hypothetical protein AM1_C0199 (plasmid) [Acaryochloris marina MBIC11017]|uniref:Uncharacterized protein n=1 Tax=Acaryochloris marina (strain MBIC 11017) TaxID=329726 RepID=A8ZMT6_ACAM1|nr:hypothetical protein AM1_C0199 [Acaryochloris marina MBIC11017]
MDSSRSQQPAILVFGDEANIRRVLSSTLSIYADTKKR